MIRRPFALLAMLAIASCSRSPNGSTFDSPALRASGAAHAPSTTTPIQHVVLIVQENRSFDNFFSTFPGADGTTTGREGSKTVPLHRAHLYERCDFGHGYNGFIRDYNGGKMNGFGKEGGSRNCPGKAGRQVYQFVNTKDIAPYWTMAQQYVLADQMFQTQGSGSYTAHQDLIRGNTTIDANQTISLVDFPSAYSLGLRRTAGYEDLAARAQCVGPLPF